MSIHHNFLIKTGQTPHQIAELLERELPFAVDITTDEELNRSGLEWKTVVTTDKAMNFTAMGVYEDEIEIAQDLFGFTPDVTVSFTLTKNPELYETGCRQMFETVAWLLERFPEDNAVFLMFNGEVSTLWRKDGKIIFSQKRYDEYNLRDIDLGYFKLPYTLGDIPEL